MSLILDALRKLEREKASREPAVLVVGSVPWGGTSRARRLAFAIVALAILAIAVVAGWLLRRAPHAPAADVVPAAVVTPRATPSPAAAPSASAPPASAAGGATTPASYPSPTLGAAPPVRSMRALPTPAGPGAAAHTTGPPAVDSAVPAAPAVAPDSAPSASAGDELRLNAISQRDGRPVALINDRLVFEGDSFDGVKVLRIGEAEVEVEVRGERRVLRF